MAYVCDFFKRRYAFMKRITIKNLKKFTRKRITVENKLNEER